MSGLTEEEKRLKFEELREALETAGYSDWTVIAFSPLTEGYKIFTHLSTDDVSFFVLEDILRKMLEMLEVRTSIVEEESKGSC